MNNELLIEPHMLLSAHQLRLNALRLECGYELSRYQLLIEAPILQVAQWVHRLPATASEHHCEPGGLLRMAVESAAVAFQRSEGRFLGGSRDGTMQDQEGGRRLRYVTFLGGLLRPLGRVLTRVRVTSGSLESSTWNPLHEPLWSWRRRTNAQTLTLRWLDESDAHSTGPVSIWIVSRLLPPEVVSHLHSGGDSLLPALLAILGGEREGPLAAIVEGAHQAVRDYELSRRKPVVQPRPVNVPVEHQLLDAMRVLCREKWTVNTERARVWCTNQGVFLDWRLAAPDLLRRLRASGSTNVPADAEALAECMLAQQLLLPNPEANTESRHCYHIQLSLRGATKQSLDVVKIADAEQLGLSLHGVDPISVEVGELAAASAVAPLRSDPGPSVQLELVTPAGSTVDPPPQVPELPPRARETSIASGEEAIHRTNESAFRRFGALGQALQRLAELISTTPEKLAVVQTTEGLVIGYPDRVALFCPRPEEFLLACEAQGLLVPERAGGRTYVRAAPPDREDLPPRYLVLAPRVVRYLGLERKAS